MKKQLNILQFICPTGFYGAERWILALAKNLDATEIKCDLAVTVEPNIKELEISKHYKKLGKDVHQIPMSGRFDVTVVSKLCKLIKDRNIDIIHTHGYKSDILGLIAARFTGIKALATPHGFENSDDWKLKTYIGLGNQFLRWFDSVVPLSKQLCKDLEKIGVAQKKVTYIQNGVDLDEVEKQRSQKDTPTSREKTNKRIGFLGQMISRKNIFDLLDIFDELKTEHQNIELVFLGDGDQRPELEIYANKLSSSASIKFLGFRNDRLEWLQSFDIFVMTSTLEGIPRCLMETMAMRVPVAAYDIPGIDQLITNNQTGLLAPLGDKQQLKKHWQNILFDEDLSAKLTENAYNFVYENFSGQRMAREYSVLFQKLLT
jgi:glycosyltransferase involved in cell wall biosynthesis